MADDLRVERYVGGVLIIHRNAAIYVRAEDLYDLAARLSRLREEIRREEMRVNGPQVKSGR
jgi:hypothetical protein